MSKFRSKVFLFPPELQEEINKMILEHNAGPRTLQKLMIERYDGDLSIPSTPTLMNYKRYILAEHENKPSELSIMDEIKKDLVVVGDELQEIDSDTSELSSKARRVALHYLIDKCYSRLQQLEKIDPSEMPATKENCIISYITEIRRIIETLLKLSGELGADDKVVVNIIDEHLIEFFKKVAITVKEVYGDDKLVLFQETLKRKLSE